MARLLIIDDDRSLLELLADYLGRLGHQIDGAPSARWAWSWPSARPMT